MTKRMRKRIDILKYKNGLSRPLVLDGAIGSLLQQRGVQIHEHLWSSYANITSPESVLEIHKEYIQAGADIVTANTFRTNPIAYERSRLKISNKEFVKSAVSLAIEAIEESEREIILAGSNPPAEDSYQAFRKFSKSEIEINHKRHIDYLWEGGVDFVLNETQSHFDEIQIICEHSFNNNIPFMISLFVTEDGEIFSGEKFTEIVKYIEQFNPIAVGINCVTTNTFENVVKNNIPNINWGFYLNCGSGDYNDDEIFEGVSPPEYVKIVRKHLLQNLFFVGSCCGSSPAHTKVIKDLIVEQN